MQAWLAWVFIARQVSYWSDVLQIKRQKSKKKDVKKKAKEQKSKGESELNHETKKVLVNGKEKHA